MITELNPPGVSSLSLGNEANEISWLTMNMLEIARLTELQPPNTLASLVAHVAAVMAELKLLRTKPAA